MKKKKVLIWFILLVIISTGIAGCFYHYENINKTIKGWIDNFIEDKTESSYAKLEMLFVQMDNNDNEIEQLNKKIEENQLLIEEKLLNNTTENANEIEKIKAVNEVFKTRVVDLEAENSRLSSEISKLREQLSLTQNQIEELKNQILSIQNQLSQKAVVELLSASTTTSQGTYNLLNGKYFSNYSVLYFIFEQLQTNQTISMVIPAQEFCYGYPFEICVSAPSVNRYMQFGYVSNNSYYLGGNEKVMFRCIYGLRK